MRVPKDDIRIEANGCLDELNAVIGIVRSMLSAEDSWQELLHAVQRELMVVMSHVATPSGVVILIRFLPQSSRYAVSRRWMP